MNKINLEVMKPWVTKKLVDLLQFEDDVLIDYVFSLLEESVIF
jgi:serine/arginine repetitive matrix protein 1